MKPVLTMVTTTAFAALVAACGSGSGPPEQQSQQDPQQVTQRDPQQILTGTGVDSNSNTGANGTPIGTTIVTWKLTQTGADVSGTVTTQSTDLPGTCASCHRSRTGTLSGTIAGTTLTWTASFPADAANDPTPSCTATLTGTISDFTGNSPSGSYSGQDLCEGLYSGGTLTLALQPAP
jgi:hypothetical protein